MRTLIFLLTLLTVTTSFGQNVFKGQVLSIVDKTPLANFSFRVDKEKLVKTDSLGSFSVYTTKDKVRLSTVFSLHSFDTTISETNNMIQLFTAEKYDSTLAVYDITHNIFKLFCGVSFAPMAMMSYDTVFEKQFHVYYYVVGDFYPSSIDQMTSYNKVVAAHLDKTYGEVWRKTVRQDVLGVTKKAGS